MKAWQFNEYGNHKDVLHWVDRDDPKPSSDGAIVQTSAVSLNFPDLLVTQGLYQVKAPLPAVPGVEGVGVVTETGEDSKFRVGDKVAGFCHGGGTLADYFEVTNNSAWHAPTHVPDPTLAALSVTYGTSYFGLVHRANLRPGETLLILGAAGGVGLAAIQLGKMLGAKVIAAAGSQEKIDVCARQGADHIINYKTQNLVDEVKRLTDGEGANVIYDPVGGDIFEQTKRCIAWDGRIIIVGFAGGSIPRIECNRMLLKNCAVIGLAWGQYIERDPQKVNSVQSHLYNLLDIGAINPVIYRTLSFDKVHSGLDLLENRGLYGNIVITR